MRKKTAKLIVCIAISALILLATAIPAFATGATSANDAYNYDSWGNVTDVPNGYEYLLSIGDSNEITFNQPRDMYYRNGRLYVLNTGDSNIVVLDKDYKIIEKIVPFSVKDGKREYVTFSEAKGIFVTEGGRLLISDTGNARVLVCEPSGEIIHTLLKPESENFPPDLMYKPVKTVMDDLGNVYVLCDGFYYGTIVYSADGSDGGFFGASKIEVTAEVIASMFWRQFMTDEQLNYTENLTPISITSIDIDDNNFIYTCTADTVSRLNFVGTNIFEPEQGPDPIDKSIYGDRNSALINGIQYKTNLSDVAISEDDFVFVLDPVMGRVFEYDKESNLLNIVGSIGNQKGTFTVPVAIETVGDDLLVLDQEKGKVTVFRTTDYGALLHEATILYHEGLFAEAYDKWETVLSYNSNLELAYRGLGRANLQDGKYEDAMYYCNLGQDRLGYSKAFRLYRSDVARKYFAPAIIIAAILIIALLILKKFWPKIKAKLNIKDREKKLFRPGYIMLHPLDFYDKLYADNSKHTIIASIVVVALFFIGEVMSNLATGFIFNKNNMTTFNAFFLIAKTVGLVAIWTASELVVGSLRFGHGTLRRVFTGTCAAVIPYTITLYLNLIISQFLTHEENAIMGIITTIGLIYTIFLLYQSVRVGQRYDAGEALVAMLLDVLVALVIILILVIVFMLVRQIVMFGATIVNEIAFRFNQ